MCKVITKINGELIPEENTTNLFLSTGWEPSVDGIFYEFTSNGWTKRNLDLSTYKYFIGNEAEAIAIHNNRIITFILNRDLCKSQFDDIPENLDFVVRSLYLSSILTELRTEDEDFVITKKDDDWIYFSYRLLSDALLEMEISIDI